ncbi:DUF982 domain-containing protein [Mesorhizobium sp. B2-4-14]|uniref:DUF982 domain-containing protein n=1 Tax=Mesorhizobium sp. B2-4-14 TaxID=2589935 RepID=UPI00112BCEE1|nr:DUF982 domain-containing protein [Mesorhizobium sp. B2-4-14]TPL07584.1 DUF982 domain-containing protein [Mesorhizobium sp. B2-4-14]
MSILWWNGRVPVRGERPGLTMMVGDVQKASEILLRWNLKGPRWKLAVKACVDAMEGRIAPDEARDAFREAAAEQGMYLPDLEVGPQ